jgi:hypothetical protein
MFACVLGASPGKARRSGKAGAENPEINDDDQTDKIDTECENVDPSTATTVREGEHTSPVRAKNSGSNDSGASGDINKTASSGISPIPSFHLRASDIFPEFNQPESDSLNGSLEDLIHTGVDHNGVNHNGINSGVNSTIPRADSLNASLNGSVQSLNGSVQSLSGSVNSVQSADTLNSLGTLSKGSEGSQAFMLSRHYHSEDEGSDSSLNSLITETIRNSNSHKN